MLSGFFLTVAVNPYVRCEEAPSRKKLHIPWLWRALLIREFSTRSAILEICLQSTRWRGKRRVEVFFESVWLHFAITQLQFIMAAFELIYITKWEAILPSWQSNCDYLLRKKPRHALFSRSLSPSSVSDWRIAIVGSPGFLNCFHADLHLKRSAVARKQK